MKHGSYDFDRKILFNLWFDDLNILESSLVILLKTFVIGIVLFLAFTYHSFVFRDTTGIRFRAYFLKYL